MSTVLKGLAAAVAVTALVGTAFAQSNPPVPTQTNPAQGAGQRSPQNTNMGATGTPAGGATGSSSTMNSGTTTGSSSTMNSGTTGSSSTMSSSTGTTGSGSTASSGTTTDSTKMASSTPTRKARADRN